MFANNINDNNNSEEQSRRKRAKLETEPTQFHSTLEQFSKKLQQYFDSCQISPEWYEFFTQEISSLKLKLDTAPTPANCLHYLEEHQTLLNTTKAYPLPIDEAACLQDYLVLVSDLINKIELTRTKTEIINKVLDYKAEFEGSLPNSSNFKKEMDKLFDSLFENLYAKEEVTKIIEESLSTFVAKIEELLTKAKQSMFPQSFLRQEIVATIQVIKFLDELLIAYDQDQTPSEIETEKMINQWRRSYLMKCSPGQLLSTLDEDTRKFRAEIIQGFSKIIIPSDISVPLREKILEFLKLFTYILENNHATKTSLILDRARMEILELKAFLKTPGILHIWKSSPDQSFYRTILNEINSTIEAVQKFEQHHAQTLELPRSKFGA